MSREDGDEPSLETVMLCKLIAESQGDMLQKLHESQGDTLRELIGSQQRSQEHMLKKLTTSFKSGLEEVLNRQNKAGGEDEKEDEADPEKKPIIAADLDGNNVLDEYQELYDKVCAGNKGRVVELLTIYFPEAAGIAITCDNETILHIAVRSRDNLEMVKELVKRMTPEALEIKDKYGSTALHVAALHGQKQAAAQIISKNLKLTQMRDEYDRIPLETAIVHVSDGQKDTVKYLYTKTRDEYPSPFSGPNGAELLCSAIESGFYDLALALVEKFPKLVTEPTDGPRGVGGLKVLIDRPFAFESGANLSRLQGYIYSLIHVDRSSSLDYKTENHSLEISEGTTGYEENRGESSDGQEGDVENQLKAKKAPSPENKKAKGVVKKFILNYIMPYYARAPLVRRLYSQKVIHQQALELVNHMVRNIKQTIPSGQDVTIYLNKNEVMKTAIEYGITEFVTVCLDEYPHLIWDKFNDLTMIQMAVQERDENILNLILETSGNDRGFLVSREDDKGNNILHYAARLAPSAKLNLVSGTALQLQREVQWYKGVEAIIHPDYKYQRNKNDETAKSIFTEQHRDLVEKGEQWIKDTSGSCMVVATLIATVAFAAVFTVPGGNIGDTGDPKNGLPVFLNKWIFLLFAIGDCGSLFASVTSVLMFLAIMTSRYSEDDFYKSLLQKLIIGLLTLFFSMSGILLAFAAAFTLACGDKYWWAPVPLAIFGLVTIILFALLEFPLFARMVVSTYYPCVFRSKEDDAKKKTKRFTDNKKKTSRSNKPIDPKKER
ncbi:hypothetical protein C5167_027765 [Papaver somniferum]|uniref:uncharacterized protein LOC113339404 n=1 Tax=Papaver somniferum TaxID=3469 RepID=UPI000E704919|nr:uncharacterized protein LOC113339404 [Papaver somniferum]RZC91700.1 hypothetical protein C5167_027765 [Papaver somniferum]